MTENMTVERRACNPGDYMLKEECEKEHAEKERYYQQIIDRSVEEREQLKHDLDKHVDKTEAYKDKINGKFDKIMITAIMILLGMVGSLVSTVYIQMNAKKEMDEKVMAINAGREYHQGISQANNVELSQLLLRLDKLTKILSNERGKKGGEKE